MKQKILLVEGNQGMSGISSEQLSGLGYCVITADSCAEAICKLESENPNIILIDIDLPDGNGIELCRKIRKVSSVPVIYLSPSPNELELVTGLQAGGDDYMDQSCGLNEFEARIAAHLRRSQINGEQIICYPPLSMNLISNQAFMGSKNVNLSQKEFQLLLLLVKNIGTVFDPELLYREIWGLDPFNVEHILRQHASSIRRKLGLTKTSPIQLKTVYGKGYYFVYDGICEEEA